MTTGIGLAMPGVLMPALLTGWHLSDRRLGAVFFCVAAGSACGALLVRGKLRRLVSQAFLSLGATALLWVRLRAYPELPVWGLSLGVAMTSISLLEKRRDPNASNLIRLNFVWSAGALLAPLVVTHALVTRRAEGVLVLFGVFCFVLAIAGVILRRRASERAGSPDSRLRLRDLADGLRGVPVALVLATVLAPGVEAACAGWLPTFADRYGAAPWLTVATASCFWAGLLLSRFLAFVPSAAALLTRCLRVLPFVVSASLVCLAVWNPWPVMVAAAFLAGFGVGPLYPALLSDVLEIRQSGATFFTAGVAASAVPYITGFVSDMTHSLRRALLVPAAVALAILLALTTLKRHVAAAVDRG